MKFSEQIIATFLGSILGFFFGIALFYLTETIKAKRQKGQLLKGLKREFEFNFLLIDNWIEDTEKILRKISALDREVFIFYRLTDFQRLFTQMCFQQGILYDALSTKELAGLNTILIHFDIGATEWLNSQLNLWKEGTLQQVAANRLFEYQRDKLKENKEQLGNMLKHMK